MSSREALSPALPAPGASQDGRSRGAPSPAPRILCILPSRIGDALLATGVLRHFRDREPRASFTIVASPLAAPLFRAFPRLEEIILMPKRKHHAHWLSLWRRLVGRRWDIVADMRGSALSYFLNVDRRVIHRSGPQIHKVISAAKLVGMEHDPPAPLVVDNEETRLAATRLLGNRSDVLALAPGANWPGKVWPAARFASLARELLGPTGPLPQGRLLLVGGGDERGLAAPIRHAIPEDRIVDGFGLDLLETFACLQRVRLFVGNDSGMMHLAAAAGAPTLGLFGPTIDQLYRPWGPNCFIVRARADEGAANHARKLDMNACHMLDLELGDVLASARRILAPEAESKASSLRW